MHEKESECLELQCKIGEVQAEKDDISQRSSELEAELFKLRAKCRDADYILSTREATIQDLEERLQCQDSATTSDIQQLPQLVAELERKLAEKESKVNECHLELNKMAEQTEQQSAIINQIEFQLDLATKENEKLELGKYLFSSTRC